MAAETTLGKLFVELLLNDEQFLEKTKDTQKTLLSLGKNVDSLGAGLSKGLATAFKVTGAAILGVLAAATALGSQFEKQMAAVSAVRGIKVLGDEYNALAAKARELGATTAFSATQAARGMEELARAGLDTNQIIAASNTALKLAGAGQLGLGRSAQVLAASMAQFSIEAENSGRIADVFTVASQNTLFSTEGLAQAMKFAGTAGAAFGMSVEETTAAVAQFRNIGLEGSMAGVQFRAMMAASAAPTSQAEAALKKYGLTAADINPQTRDFADIMQTLGEKGLEAGDAIQIFGQRVGANVAKVASNFGKSRDEFDGLQQALEDSAGATDEAYATMTDNVIGRFMQIKSATEEVLIGIFETFRAPLTDLLEAIVGFAQDVANELAIQSEAMGGGFEDMLGQVTQFIRENSAAAAKALVQFAVSLQNAAQAAMPLVQMLGRIAMMLSKLAPWVDEIAIALASMWAVPKLIMFVGMIGKMVIAIKSATVAVAAFGVALNLSTGGLVAVAAVITTIVVALGSYVKKTVDAKNATNDLTAAQAENARQQQQSRENISGMIAFRLAETKALALEERNRLRAAGELTKADKARIDSMLRLNESEAARQWRLGEIIALEDKLVKAEELATSTEGRARLNDEVNSTTAAIGKLEKQFESAKGESKRLFKQELTEARNRLVNLHNTLDDTTKSQEDATDASGAQADALSKLRDELAGAGGEAESSAGKFDKLSDALRELNRELTAMPFDALQADMDARRDNLRDMFNEMLADEKMTAAKRLELERELQEALSAVDALEAKKRKEKKLRTIESQEEKARQIIDGFLEQDLKESEQKAKEKNEVLAELSKAGADQRAFIERAYNAEINDLRQKEAEEAGDIIDDQEEDALGFWDKLGGSAKAAAKVASDAWKMVSSVLGDVVSQMTGFSFNMQDAVGEIIDAQDQAADAQVDAAESLAEAQAKLQEAKEGGDAGEIAEAQAGVDTAAAALADADAAVGTTAKQWGKEIVTGMVEDAVRFVETLAQSAGPLLTALADGIPVILDAIIEALPAVTQALVNGIPKILFAVVNSLDELLPALIDAGVKVIVAVVEVLPELLLIILRDVVPEVMMALVEALPLLIEAVIAAIPQLVAAIIAALPQIVAGLFKALLKGVGGIFKAIAEGIWNAIKGFFNIFKKKDKKGKKGGKKGAFSGMSYVPATMRMTVHKGEAIVPADRNAEGSSDIAPAPAGATQNGFGGGGGGSSQPIDIAVMAEGRVLDAVQIRAMNRGGAVGVKNEIRRASGVKVGLDTGRFNPWSKA